MAFFYLRSSSVYLLIFSIGLCCSSCFDIKEELYIKKDGSGHFRMLLDFSENKEMLTKLREEASKSKQPVFGEPQNKPFEELVSIWVSGATSLNEINGINNAIAITNKEAFVYGWEFDFEDVNALNLVLALRDGGEFNTSYLPSYSFQKKQLTKYDVFSFWQLFKQLSEKKAAGIDIAIKKQKKAIFANTNYQCSISVEGKIKKYSNKNYQLSADKKRLLLITKLPEVDSGTVYLGNHIKFK